MADTNTKITYVSLENLNYYDDKIKDYIQTRDEALQVNIDSANTAISNEETRAKAAEATNAKAAQDAQDSVNSLAEKIGTVPADTTVMDIITNIQENAYDDTELKDLISGLDTNKADKTQVDDYYKAAVAETGKQDATAAQKNLALNQFLTAFYNKLHLMQPQAETDPKTE